MNYYHVNGGIGNRFNIIVNALIDTHWSGEKARMLWPVNEHLRAPVEDVFRVSRLYPERLVFENRTKRVAEKCMEPYAHRAMVPEIRMAVYDQLYAYYGRQIVLATDETPESRPVLHIRALRGNIKIPWDALHEELDGVENVRLCTDSRKALVLAMEKLPWFTSWTPVTGTHDLHNRGNIQGILSDFMACCWASKLWVVAPRESAFTDAATHAYHVPTVRVE